MKLSFSQHCLMSAQTWRIEICGSQVHAQFPDGENNEHDLPSAFRINANALEQIRALLRLLEIHRWKPRYAPEDMDPPMGVVDGGSWELDYTDGVSSIRTEGENAGPALADPAQSCLENNRVAILDHMLQSILGLAYQDWDEL